MPRSTAPKTPRKPQLDTIKAVNLRLSVEAADALAQLAPTAKAHGRFVSDLILDHQRRNAFKNFYEREASRQLKRLCKQMIQDARRHDGAEECA